MSRAAATLSRTRSRLATDAAPSARSSSMRSKTTNSFPYFEALPHEPPSKAK